MHDQLREEYVKQGISGHEILSAYDEIITPLLREQKMKDKIIDGIKEILKDKIEKPKELEIATIAVWAAIITRPTLITG